MLMMSSLVFLVLLMLLSVVSVRTINQWRFSINCEDSFCVIFLKAIGFVLYLLDILFIFQFNKPFFSRIRHIYFFFFFFFLHNTV